MTDLPPIHRWWVTYLLIGASAVIAVLWALGSIAGFLQPVREILIVLLFGIVFAFLLAPIVSLLQRVLPRPLAVAGAALVAILLIATAIALIAAPVVQEGRMLMVRIPAMVTMMQSPDPILLGGFEIPGDVKQKAGLALADRTGELAQQSVRFAMRAVTAILEILMVLVLGIYFVAAAPKIRAAIQHVLPQRIRPTALKVEDEVGSMFGRYVRGQVLLGAIIGVLSYIAFVLLGLPYALLLALIAGIFTFVPIIGPIVAGAVAAAVALSQPQPYPLVLWVIIAAIIIQQIESQLVAPRVQGRAVGIHPLAALLTVVTGIQLFGIVGGLFALPTVGIATIYGRRWLAAREERYAREAATRAGSPTA